MSLKSWLELSPKLIHFLNRKCIYRRLSNIEILVCILRASMILFFLFAAALLPQVLPLFSLWISMDTLKKNLPPSVQIADFRSRFFHLFFVKSCCHCCEFDYTDFHFSNAGLHTSIFQKYHYQLLLWSYFELNQNMKVYFFTLASWSIPRQSPAHLLLLCSHLSFLQGDFIIFYSPHFYYSIYQYHSRFLIFHSSNLEICSLLLWFDFKLQALVFWFLRFQYRLFHAELTWFQKEKQDFCIFKDF